MHFSPLWQSFKKLANCFFFFVCLFGLFLCAGFNLSVSLFLQRRARCCAAATASTTRAPVCVTAAGKDPSATSLSHSA